MQELGQFLLTPSERSGGGALFCVRALLGTSADVRPRDFADKSHPPFRPDLLSCEGLIDSALIVGI